MVNMITVTTKYLELLEAVVAEARVTVLKRQGEEPDLLRAINELAKYELKLRSLREIKDDDER